MRTSLKLIAVTAVLGMCVSVEAQNARPAISVTVSGPSTTIKPGSDIKLTITVKNISNDEIRIVRENGGNESLNPIEAWDEKGNTPPRSDFYDKREQQWADKIGKVDDKGGVIVEMPVASMSTYRMKPGETFKEEVFASHQFDFSKPGTYSIQLSRVDPVTNSSVKSNKITLRVAP